MPPDTRYIMPDTGRRRGMNDYAILLLRGCRHTGAADEFPSSPL